MTSKAINDASENLKRDNVGAILAYLERENQRAREHEMKLFSMFANGYHNHKPYHIPFPPQNEPSFSTRGVVTAKIQTLLFFKMLPCISYLDRIGAVIAISVPTYGHVAKEYYSKWKCRQCNEKHNTLLCQNPATRIVLQLQKMKRTASQCQR